MPDTDNKDVLVFDGKEYSWWRFWVRLQIEVKWWYPALEQDFPTSAEENVKEEWKHIDVKAWNELVKYMSNNIVDTVSEYKMAR